MAKQKKQDKKLNITRVRIRKGAMVLVFQIILILFILMISQFLISIFISLFITPAGSDDIYLITIIQMFVALIFFVLAIFVSLQWKNDYYEILKDGIVHKSGVIFKRELAYSCSNIESVQLYQGLLGNLFGYGTIELYDPALKKKIYLINISSPQRYIKLLKKIYLKIPSKKARIIFQS